MKSIKIILITLFTLCLVGCGSKEEEHEHDYYKGECECGEIKEGYYKITFKTGGGSKVSYQIVKKGNKAVKPKEPTKKDYYFYGWYYNGEEFDFDTEITKNYTLTAKWSEDNTIISVMKDGNVTDVLFNYTENESTYKTSISLLPDSGYLDQETTGILYFYFDNTTEYYIGINNDVVFDNPFFEFSTDINFDNVISDVEDLIGYFELSPNTSCSFTIYWRWIGDFSGDIEYTPDIKEDIIIGDDPNVVILTFDLEINGNCFHIY